MCTELLRVAREIIPLRVLHDLWATDVNITQVHTVGVWYFYRLCCRFGLAVP